MGASASPSPSASPSVPQPGEEEDDDEEEDDACGKRGGPSIEAAGTRRRRMFSLGERALSTGSPSPRRDARRAAVGLGAMRPPMTRGGTRLFRPATSTVASLAHPAGRIDALEPEPRSTGARGAGRAKREAPPSRSMNGTDGVTAARSSDRPALRSSAATSRSRAARSRKRLSMSWLAIPALACGPRDSQAERREVGPKPTHFASKRPPGHSSRDAERAGDVQGALRVHLCAVGGGAGLCGRGGPERRAARNARGRTGRLRAGRGAAPPRRRDRRAVPGQHARGSARTHHAGVQPRGVRPLRGGRRARRRPPTGQPRSVRCDAPFPVASLARTPGCGGTMVFEKREETERGGGGARRPRGLQRVVACRVVDDSLPAGGCGSRSTRAGWFSFRRRRRSCASDWRSSRATKDWSTGT